jgi:hypothetical protein
VLEPAFDTLIWLNPEPGKTFNRDFGGMSGGPVFRVVDGLVLRLELGGFIRAFAIDAENPAAEGEAVLATHADLIAANGDIAQ